MTSALAANRINHADLAFDADYTTVVGTDERDFMVGSFMEMADIENHDCHLSPMDGCGACERYASRGKYPMTEEEYRRRVNDGQGI